MVLRIFKIHLFFFCFVFFLHFQIYWQKIVYKWLSSKESACNSGDLQEILSLGQEDPLEKNMAVPPVFLPRKSHGQRSLAGCHSWGCKESDMTEGLNNIIELSLLLLFILNTIVYLFYYLKEPAYVFLIISLCSISLISGLYFPSSTSFDFHQLVI